MAIRPNDPCPCGSGRKYKHCCAGKAGRAPQPQANVAQVLQQALAHHQAGHMPQAEALYRQALAAEPLNPDALHLLGVLAYQVGQLAAAVDLIARAVAVNPAFAQAHYNLGIALKDQGRLEDAASAYRRAIAVQPDYADAHDNLGNVLLDLGRAEEAVPCYRRAIALRPGNPVTHNNLGIALKQAGQLQEAATAYRQAIALKPDYVEAHNNLGNALKELGQLEEAAQCFQRALAIRPELADAHSNLGIVLLAQGRADEAAQAYERAIALNPDFAEARNNLALIQLLKGDFEHGWEGYEWRWKLKVAVAPRRDFPQPEWRGEQQAGERVLVHAEQGFGDAIQFCRYIPLMAQRGAKVILEVQPELKRLLASLAGVDELATMGEVLPSFDCHIPLLSLPRVFGTRLETVPADIPYLQAPPVLVEAWREKLSGMAGLRVGLAWAGSPQHMNDRNRSLALSTLAPLAAVGGATYVVLQKGPAVAQAATPPAGMKLIDLGAELGDFADTAAVVANLDLVIAVDTAVAHLAGALGKTVWLLLPFAGEWRWLQERSDSPWYPSMRLFRQPRPGAWGEVLEAAVQELGAMRAQDRQG